MPSRWTTAIRQRYAVLPFRQKVDALVRILAVTQPADAADTADAAVVFVRTRGACEEVGAQLDKVVRGLWEGM